MRRVQIGSSVGLRGVGTGVQPRPALIYKKCFTCEAAIECDLFPVGVAPGIRMIPLYNAPFICRECRKDEKKFRLARTAMFKYFGWTETHKVGAPARELE